MSNSIALRYANKYIIKKNLNIYIGSTTTNHGADIAISRHTGIQHDGHTGVPTIQEQTNNGRPTLYTHSRHRPKVPHTKHNKHVKLTIA